MARGLVPGPAYLLTMPHLAGFFYKNTAADGSLFGIWAYVGPI